MSPLYLATIFFFFFDNLTTLVFLPRSIVAPDVAAITAAKAGSTATGWAATCSAIFSSALCSSRASNILVQPIFPKDVPSSESPKSL